MIQYEAKSLHIPPALKIDMPHETKARALKRKHAIQMKEIISHQKPMLVDMKMKLGLNWRIPTNTHKKIADRNPWQENTLLGKGVDYAKSCLTIKNSSIFIQNLNTTITNMCAVKLCAHKFLCTFCSKGFHFTSELNKHLKVHSDERSYKCSSGDHTYIQDAQ